jgi:hypothetical protein
LSEQRRGHIGKCQQQPGIRLGHLVYKQTKVKCSFLAGQKAQITFPGAAIMCLETVLHSYVIISVNFFDQSQDICRRR